MPHQFSVTMRVCLFLFVVGTIVVDAALDDLLHEVPLEDMNILTADSENFQKVTADQALFRFRRGKSTFIPLSKGNIFDHGGFANGGSGPEHLLTMDGYWNPNPKPWFVTFDFTRRYKVNKVKLINTGDTTHDVTSFKIESLNDDKTWTLVDVIDKVESGTKEPQYFSISGEGQFWRLTITQTASKYQPWVKFFGFFGEMGTPQVEVRTLKPIIGVLAQDLGKKMKNALPQYSSYIAASYVKFLESGGARVVPILINQNDTYYENMVNSLNGIVFPGGGASITSYSGYGRAGRKLYDLIVASGQKGYPVPLWATCLGFEMLLYLAANGPSKYQVLTSCSASDISIPLELKRDWKRSTLLGSAPESVVQPLITMDITSNFHKYCVLPKTFEKYSLNREFVVVSTNLDKEGLEFISTVEHKTLPIWGTQYHIEKNLFEWKDNSNIPHFPEAIHVAHYFAQFFGDQARQNGNRFKSSSEERKHLIYNYNPIYLTPFRYSHNYWSSFHQAYLFK